MSEIEKTIKALKTRKWEHDRFGDTTDCFDKAIQALQEKAEREKGCEYCAGNNYRDRKLIPMSYSHTPAEVIIDSDNCIYISNEYQDISINTDKLNYCPMCGRKLVEE